MPARPCLRTWLVVWCLTSSALAPAQQTGAPGNHLAGSKSAYLSQAASQPIHWFPLGKEAFEQARKLDRPLLVDVGATWCKWCAIMDRESYTDPKLAAFINDNFIPVKVDYDADPALSAQFERAQAYMNFPAGLPVTAFVTPDSKLFAGGTHFLAKPINDRSAFRPELESALRQYRKERGKIEKEGFALQFNFLKETHHP